MANFHMKQQSQSKGHFSEFPESGFRRTCALKTFTPSSTRPVYPSELYTPPNPSSTNSAADVVVSPLADFGLPPLRFCCFARSLLSFISVCRLTFLSSNSFSMSSQPRFLPAFELVSLPAPALSSFSFFGIVLVAVFGVILQLRLVHS